jgi:hypothetical protein
MRAETAFTCLSSRTVRFLAALRMWLQGSELGYISKTKGSGSGDGLRSLDIAELGSLDLKATVALLCRFTDLISDMLSLTITVGPDAQALAIFCLLLDILGNVGFVLEVARSDDVIPKRPTPLERRKSYLHQKIPS